MMTRERYVELTSVANVVVDYLKEKEVSYAEGCTVREIAEKLWNIEHSSERDAPQQVAREAPPRVRDLRIDPERR